MGWIGANAMMTIQKISLISTLAVVAGLAATASADRRAELARTKLGEVGTHVHDQEDYVPVAGGRFQHLELRARDSAVSLNDVRVQFADGRIERVDAHRLLRPGEPFVLDVPRADQPIK